MHFFLRKLIVINNYGFSDFTPLRSDLVGLIDLSDDIEWWIMILISRDKGSDLEPLINDFPLSQCLLSSTSFHVRWACLSIEVSTTLINNNNKIVNAYQTLCGQRRVDGRSDTWSKRFSSTSCVSKARHAKLYNTHDHSCLFYH